MDWTTELIRHFPDLAVCIAQVEQAHQLLSACFRGGGKLLVCGNGGSAADSEHIVGELMKGYLLKRPLPELARQALRVVAPGEGDYLAEHLQGALPAISLVSQTALISAFANDVAADMVYAQQVYGYGRPGDVLWTISTSGNARNVVNAAQVARAMGLKVLGLTGPGGGRLKTLCDVAICVPGDCTPAVQERHLPVYHALCARLETEFFSGL
jgi:D-sedoheptulose 7-phosphate isomerase